MKPSDTTVKAAPSRLSRLAGVACLGGALLGLAACEQDPATLPWAQRPVTQDYVFAGGFEAKAADVEKGRIAYIKNCYACHGMDGDGRGPAAAGYRPPPRDFRTASFKFGEVRSGELPNDESLFRIIRGGLHGTPMLQWEVPDAELWNIISFIKTFPPPPCDPKKQGEEACAKEAEQYPEGKPNKWLQVYTSGKKKGEPKPIGDVIEVPEEDPWAGKVDQALQKGAELYHLKAQCANCHPSYLTRQELSDLALKVEGKAKTSFRENMYQSIVLAAKDNPYGVALMPPDFTINPIRSVRDGHEMYDLWRLIAAGVGGVMPAWIDGLKPDEIWALAHYIKSLKDLASPVNREARQALWERLENQPAFQPPEPDPVETTLVIADEGMKLDDSEIADDEALGKALAALGEKGPVIVTVEGDASEERLAAIKKVLAAAKLKEIKWAEASEPNPGEEQPEGKPDGAPDSAPDGAPEPAPGGVAIPGDPDALDPKGKTKVPPTPTPPVPR
ncbi:MAG: c-type cytochrome [Polyangiaceae bacterium]